MCSWQTVQNTSTLPECCAWLKVDLLPYYGWLFIAFVMMAVAPSRQNGASIFPKRFTRFLSMEASRTVLFIPKYYLDGWWKCIMTLQSSQIFFKWFPYQSAARMFGINGMALYTTCHDIPVETAYQSLESKEKFPNDRVENSHACKKIAAMSPPKFL